MHEKSLRFSLFLTLLVLSALAVSACSGSTTEQQSPRTTEEPQAAQTEGAEEHEDEHTEGDEHEEDEHLEGEEHEEGNEHDAAEHEEDEHAHADLPHEYEGFENPFGDDNEAIAVGGELFATNCATCHGESGEGDGPAAVGLDPQPATLADSAMMEDLSEAYIFWRITEGGTMEPFNSAMPPWGDSLTEDQRWQLVSFVRSLSE